MTEKQASKMQLILMIFQLIVLGYLFFIGNALSEDYDVHYEDLNNHITEWNEQASKFTKIIHKHNENYLSKTDSLCPAMLRLEQHFRTSGQYERMEY